MKILHTVLIALCAVSLLSCNKANETVGVIPQPNSVHTQLGHFTVNGASVQKQGQIDELSSAYIDGFAQMLSSKLDPGKGTSSIVFECDPSLGEESYTLSVTRKQMRVSASSLNGFVYAIQTIRQLLPQSVFSAEPCPGETWKIRCMTIEDSPRFSYRGMHLDVSRHFFSVEEVLRYIDMMEIHKMNRLHWHLTDDQGWRIEIKKYPELTKVGAWRSGTMIGRDFSSNDNIPYGGYYTQEELRYVVDYAARRGITIIPEIDLPGHMQAALATYPKLGCTGGPYEVWRTWGVSENVLCAGKEGTFTFIEDVLTEIMDIFPSEYIHIGGDECPKVQWKKCPSCQAKIKALGYKADDHFSAEDYLQTYVMNRVECFLNDHGRRVIGWDEILEGDISQSATIMSWRGTAGGIKAARSGRDAIMTPNSHMYFDYCQTRDYKHEPTNIGGYTPVDKVYSYEPHDPAMSDEDFKHILGVQANLWTEYIPSDEQLEYMYMPRISALSEVQWCQPERKDWERFRRSLTAFTAVFDMLGYNYATHVFDGRLDAERADIGTYSHKACGRPAQALTEPYSSYRYNVPVELFDGKRGDADFSSGRWIGYLVEPMVVVVDMGGKSFSSVMLEILSDKGNYIFAPTWIRISTSQDGESYTEIASAEYAPQGGNDDDGVMQFTLDFEKTRAKYLKVESGTLERLPDWHPGAGSKAFLFVDEIVVR